MAAANDNTTAKNVIYASFQRTSGIVGQAITKEQTDAADSGGTSEYLEGVKSVSRSISGLHDIVYKTLATLQSRSLLDQYITDDQLRVELENTREGGTASLLPSLTNAADIIGGGGEESMMLNAFGMLSEQIKDFAAGIKDLAEALEQKAQCTPNVVPDVNVAKSSRGRNTSMDKVNMLPSQALDTKGRLKKGWRPVKGPGGKVRYVRSSPAVKPSTTKKAATKAPQTPMLSRVGIARPILMGAGTRLGLGFMVGGAALSGAMALGPSLLSGATNFLRGAATSTMGFIESVSSGATNFVKQTLWGDSNTSRDNISLTRIKTRSGKTAEVATPFATNFQGFINDLEATGYKIREIHGYSNRDVVGSPGVKSMHAAGAAIDINPAQNPYGPRVTDMPVDKVRALAVKWGLGWGYNWKSKSDAMHFSVAQSEGGTVALNPTTGAGMDKVRPQSEFAGQPTTASPPTKTDNGQRPLLKGIDPRWSQVLSQSPSTKKKVSVIVPPASIASPPATSIMAPRGGASAPTVDPRDQYAAYFR